MAEFYVDSVTDPFLVVLIVMAGWTGLLVFCTGRTVIRRLSKIPVVQKLSAAARVQATRFWNAHFAPKYQRVVPEGTRLNAEDLEAACARSGFTKEEAKRLHMQFSIVSGGARKVETASLLTGISELKGPLQPRISGALRLTGSRSRTLDFQAVASALGVFSERTPGDDKTRFMFRLYDGDGDDLITPGDLRELLEMIVPPSQDGDGKADEERSEMIERAVEGTFEELLGCSDVHDGEGLTLDQFALVAGDLAAERCTVFF